MHINKGHLRAPKLGGSAQKLWQERPNWEREDKQGKVEATVPTVVPTFQYYIPHSRALKQGSSRAREYRESSTCPAEPNLFSAVVDKIMTGATEEMRKLADEAIAKVYNPFESRRVEAPLPKNHVQTEFGINLR